ncbi:MAG: SirB2 family protein [Gammaproteobacteria bacterium]|nr:SirB2 family protein [Gammaproteobacteria bacterium]
MLLKTVHMTCAALSLGGFVLRGIWMLRDSPLLRARLTRILPHINDTVLLGSALWLAFRIEQYPFVHGWLTAKVLALLAYIVLGSIALKRGKTKTVRAAAYVLALIAFLYIVGVALTRNPLPGL